LGLGGLGLGQREGSGLGLRLSLGFAFGVWVLVFALEPLGNMCLEPQRRVGRDCEAPADKHHGPARFLGIFPLE